MRVCGSGGRGSGEGSRKKYCYVRGGHCMKNKDIERMCFVNSTRSAKKAPMQKCAKNAKNYQRLKKFSSLVSLTRHFTEFIFLEQLTAMPQVNMQNMFFFFFFFFFFLLFFFFFLSSHHDTNPLLHLYHFRKKI